ncbi:N-acetylmuramoyl-L-alanine amidase family protein [Brumimicrobium aurantiacum]|uniref:N-acetylmuramoyl-L-alanine amidase family protein n=1 Tax=Brumimicrobium aurantiacum TaxID=1737063 RepID=UPI0014020CDB|nr:N-acetylmuramoyl-L-alanine amidase [Brumimicrobium aurantiacum]
MWSKKYKTIVLFILLILNSAIIAQENIDEVLSNGIKTVVIDPGHGGKDPGCHGGITNEKTVVLAIGLKLGEYIKSKYPHIEVIFTRDDDHFVELDERAKIANENDADVFISIHANAAGAAAYGTETYVLGLHRTESQQQVAERENSTILFEENSEEKYKDFELTPDAIIARQLQLSVFLNQSINLASKIQGQFKIIGRRDRGVKQAGFLVLYKTTMPSVLIETGFLTNHKEEKFLNDPVNQIKMANVIFKAFQEYVAEIEGVNTLVENGEGFESSINKIEEKKDNEEVVYKEEKDKVYFKVQVETSRTPLPLNDKRFLGVAVKEYRQDGLYKYTAGLFEGDFDAANKYKRELKEQGFEYAFVVGFVNGERIPIADAIKLAN